ncbi:hypothetical protein [Microscilla marina]|uniref:Uncharacterized protein n=1 Tax=Microscilla marina ATCC 23134 TaxID=313606 RepID=A1ZPS2_MICM2|nr:hypothetical protein [Microscilla marina]EAY27577.1 hypothetical protein M23134_02824 [Microscilla marina ATCC 23134]
MTKIDKTLLSFESLYEVFDKFTSQTIKASQISDDEEARDEYDYILGEFTQEMAKICAIQYSEKVLKSENPQKQYKEDLMNAAQDHNLSLLEVLLLSQLFSGDFFNPSPKEVLFMLTKLIEPYRYNKEQGEQYQLGYIFEQLMEWLNEEQGAFYLMETMLGFTKVTKEWYEGLLSSFLRIRELLPRDNKKSFDLIKKGYEIFPPSLALDFRDFIQTHYVKKGWQMKNTIG